MREVARAVVEVIDSVAADRVLVFGSLPPDGRDLDLLVRPSEEEALARAFALQGMLPRNHKWVIFRNCSAYRVELVPVRSWPLPTAEADALFDEASPVEGSARLFRPASYHQLLIYALRVTNGRGLAEKHRARIADALAEDPAAWDRAHERSPAWGIEDALERIHEAFANGHTLPAPRSRPRRRRGHVVTLSGLDGAGKSAQAWGIIEALERTGNAAAVEHVPLGSDRVLWVIGGLAQRFVRKTARLGLFTEAARRAEAGASILGDPAHPAPGGGPLRGVLTQGWATFVALANAFTQWRTASRHVLAGRIVIHDRYTLDSVVRLRTLYGETTSFRLQRWLIQRLSPRPLCSFLLDVSPETALERKRDRWTLEQLRGQAKLYRAEHERLGVRRIDGERPTEEICAEIAAAVWQALSKSA
jgi:thymidylate kinase